MEEHDLKIIQNTMERVDMYLSKLDVPEEAGFVVKKEVLRSLENCPSTAIGIATMIQTLHSMYPELEVHPIKHQAQTPSIQRVSMCSKPLDRSYMHCGQRVLSLCASSIKQSVHKMLRPISRKEATSSARA